MKSNITTAKFSDSTYALLLHSEEKERNLSESFVYLLFTLSAVFSIWQVAQQPLTIPADLTQGLAPMAQTAEAQPHGV